MKLKRYEGNPILSPNPELEWENSCACNPGAWYDGSKVYLLYRAGPDNDQHPIYFGLAESTDGQTFTRTSKEPAFGPSNDGFDGGCVEDARIVKYGDIYYVTYATRLFPPGPYWKKVIPLNVHNPGIFANTPESVRQNLTRSALAATRDFKTWFRLGPITPASVDDRDAILFPIEVGDQCVMLHRPAEWVGPQYGCDRPSIWISFGPDLMSWKEDHLLAKSEYDWESQKVGGGTPPVLTDKGWVTLYHGVDDEQVYRVGALLLDAQNPRKVLARTPEPIFEPETDYETEGLVPHVVFPTGNVVIDDVLHVYYGAADTHTGLATVPLQELVDHLLANPWKG